LLGDPLRLAQVHYTSLAARDIPLTAGIQASFQHYAWSSADSGGALYKNKVYHGSMCGILGQHALQFHWISTTVGCVSRCDRPKRRHGSSWQRSGYHCSRYTYDQGHALANWTRRACLTAKLTAALQAVKAHPSIFVFSVVLYDVVQPSLDRLSLPFVTTHSNRSIFDAPEVVVHHRRVSLQCTALLTSLAVTSPLLSLSERWSVDISGLSKVRYWCARRIHTDHLLARCVLRNERSD